MIFVDEFGFHRGFTRRYGYAPRGQRAKGAVPDNSDPNLTLVCGLDRRGVVAPFVFEGAMDGNAFAQYVRRQLGPHLRPGDVVVADGLGAHRSLEAKAAVERRGATLVLLPPYSPDLTPVEECGSKVKAIVRGLDPRTTAAVHDAVRQGLLAVETSDAEGWFGHRAAYLPAGGSLRQRGSHKCKRKAL